MNIIFEKRQHDWIAYFKGNLGQWGAGKSHYEAIGNLMCAHQAETGIKIETPEQAKAESATPAPPTSLA